MEQTRKDQPTPVALTLNELVRDWLVCGVLAVDLRERICAFNAGAEKLTGLKSGAVIGQRCDVLPEPLRKLIADTRSAGSEIADRRMQFPGVDGGGLAVRAASTCCKAEGGECAGVLVVMNDAAAAKTLGVNMERLNRLASIGTVSASMAHEVKNALVAVNTFVQDLVERNKDSELAALVGRELRRIDAIVSQMLRFAGPGKPTFSRISVHSLLDHSLRLIQPQLQSHKIRLRRSFTAKADALDGDDYQLEQVFLNIFFNAIAAMKGDGQLSVCTEIVADPNLPSGSQAGSAGGAMCIEISDTGIGIPPENCQRLFEPFYSTKSEGTGLGLTIARRIVQEHHGAICVASELGKGTTFRITLPLATANG